MISRLSFLVLATVAFCSPAIQAAAPLSGVPAPEVRLLVDISGSMKQNDPNNLRRPALNLVARLLPDSSRAGVWTFGRMVNPLIPLAPVDEAWRVRATQQVDQIRSVALFTNIGGVLEAASADLKRGASGEGVHFILLTDGMVDISEEAEANARERARILSEVLAPIRRSGARLHTIALSRNADTSLMRSLALETGGLFSVADSPETLSRIFLQALDQAVPAEQVPLENNGFSIDESVREFTALVFLKEGAQPVGLVDPSGRRFSQDSHPDQIRWFQDQGFELITVSKPTAGHWTLEAEVQPGSRVTLVTDLKMKVSPLPANFFPGDVLELTAGFYEGEQRITAGDFLKLIDVDVRVSNEMDLEGTKRISVSGQAPEDGLYRDVIRRLPEAGRYTVTVMADGKTFRRQQSQQIHLNPPVDVELQGAGNAYRLVVMQRSQRILPQRTEVTVGINGPDGSRVIRALPYDAEARHWSIELEPFGGDGRYVAQLAMEGAVEGGQGFDFMPGPVSVDFPRDVTRLEEYRLLLDEEEAGQLVAEVAEAIEPSTPATESEDSHQSSEGASVELAPGEVELSDGKPRAAGLDQQPKDESRRADQSGWAKVLVWSAAGLGGSLMLIGLGFWMKSRRTPESSLVEVAQPAHEAKAPKPELAPEPEPQPEAPPEASEPTALDADPAPQESQEERADTVEAFEMPEADDSDQFDEVDERTPEEIADAILAENQLFAALEEEEFGMEDLDISEDLSIQDPEEDNKPG